jgi:spermidine/putrescine transport system permease protein
VSQPAAAPSRGRGSSLVPFLLSAPGLAFLVVFFAIPMATMFSLSLQEGTIEAGFRFTGRVANYSDALSQYGDIMVRSLIFGLLTTIGTLLISYPLAYWIAFKAGRRKNLFLLLLLLPYFTPFLIRTYSWQQILSDNGLVLGTLKNWGLLPDDFIILTTATAVVAGMIYNFLPFMALPLYVALERIDPRLLDAASDLYSSRREAFRRVTLPLSLPGVFAGSLLTFIPAVGDFVDEEYLGGTRSDVIGTVIKKQFIESFEYPPGSALAFMMIGVIIIGVFLYARALGTEDLSG